MSKALGDQAVEGPELFERIGRHSDGRGGRHVAVFLSCIQINKTSVECRGKG